MRVREYREIEMMALWDECKQAMTMREFADSVDDLRKTGDISLKLQEKGPPHLIAE